MDYTDFILTVIAVFILLDWLQDTDLGRIIVYNLKYWLRKQRK